MEALDEVVTNGRFHEQSRTGQTDLTAVVVHDGGFLGGGVEVGVGEDDEGSLASEFRREWHEVLGGRRSDESTGLGRSGE